MQAAMFALQDETQRKMNALLSDELELRRQAGQLEWIDSFIETAADTLPPMSFVTAWERVSALRASVYSSARARLPGAPVADVAPDIILEGTLKVTTARDAAAAAARGGGGGGVGASAPTDADDFEGGGPQADPVADFWNAVLRSS